MNDIIQIILDALKQAFRSSELVTTLIAAVPIVEARLAVPIGMGLGMSPLKSWLFAYLGSSALAPLLLVVLIPFIRFLARTRLFRKIGSAIYDKFEKKSRKVAEKAGSDSGGDGSAPAPAASAPPDGNGPGGVAAKRRFSADLKKMLGVFLFVAVPLPLTGVWTGCAVASIVGLGYFKSLAAVLGGNLVASLIILLLCVFFAPYVNYIILAIAIVAAIVVIALLVKIVLHKPEDAGKNDKE